MEIAKYRNTNMETVEIQKLSKYNAQYFPSNWSIKVNNQYGAIELVSFFDMEDSFLCVLNFKPPRYRIIELKNNLYFPDDVNNIA